MSYDDLDWLDESDPIQTAKLLEAIKQAIKQVSSVDKPQNPAVVVADSLNGVEPCEDCGCKLFETYLGGDVPKRSHVCCVRCGTKRKVMSVDHQHTYHHALKKFAESSIKFHQALKDAGIPFESVDGSTTITVSPEQMAEVDKLFCEIFEETSK